MTQPFAHDQQKEVDDNYAAFRELLPALLKPPAAGLMPEHAGRFAVMRGRKIVEFMDTKRDAATYAHGRFADGRFSVQEVTDQSIFMSRPSRPELALA